MKQDVLKSIVNKEINNFTKKSLTHVFIGDFFSLDFVNALSHSFTEVDKSLNGFLDTLNFPERHSRRSIILFYKE
tara:strand:- start:151 stop:375 length:225 start_codon:yes stop_codon:yes gene_type:complete